MAIQTFDIFFSGQLMESEREAEVKEKIGQLLKANPAQLEQLFSGRPIRIKSAVDEEMATRYRVAFRNAGALIEIRPAAASPPGDTAPAAPSGESQPSSDTLTLLPPRTGSLVDCTPQVTPQPLPDISSLSLAAQDRNLDESEEIPPPVIDTSDLSLAPTNTGSLEDCTPAVASAPLPDISALQLEEREPPAPARETE
jgi:hypothetical protein